MKRFAAGANSFTIDFGEYENEYYVVRTPCGEQISQLLNGYIDIMLKRRRGTTLAQMCFHVTTGS